MKRFIAIIMTLCLVLGMSSVSVLAEEVGWQNLTNIPIEAYWNYAVAVEDKIYVVSGDNTDADKNIIQIYDTKTKLWTTGAKRSLKSTNWGVCLLGRNIYVFGGRNNSLAYNTVSIYNIDSNTWTEGKPMPTSRYGTSAVAIKDKIYVFGGSVVGEIKNTVEIYNTIDGTWTSGKNMPYAACNPALQIIGDDVYLLGGQYDYNSGAMLNKGQIYSVNSNTWADSITMPTQGYVTTCKIDDKLYVMGGNTNNSSTNQVNIYNLQNKEWTSGSNLLGNRFLASTVVINGQIYVVGGFSDFAGTKVNYIETLKVKDTLTKLSILLNEGETVQLSTSYNLDNNKNYTWSSTNQAIATVDSNGKVTAVAEGTVDIYAQNADGTFKEYIPVKVTALADEQRLAVHLKAGEKAKLYLTDDASKVTWSSMDNSIATISTEGQVTGVKKGLAIVKAELDGQTYQIYVRVNG